MWTEYLKSIWIILPVALITTLLEGARLIWGPKTGNSSGVGTLFGFLIVSLGFGFLAIAVLHWINARWPQNSEQVYFYLALGIGGLLTIMAVGMHFFFKSSWLDVAVWTAINVAYVVGYGWFMPKVLA